MKIKISFILLFFVPFFIQAQELTEREKIEREALVDYSLAQTSDQMGNYDRAIEYYLKAYALDSVTYSDAYTRVGNSYCGALKYKEALPYFQKYLDKFPEKTESYMNMGNTYYVLGEYEKAIPYYEKVVALDSTHKIAYRNMGNSYYHLKNTEKYLECFKKAARLNDYEIQQWLRANNETW